MRRRHRATPRHTAPARPVRTEAAGLVLGLGLLFADAAGAQPWLADTRLLDIRLGSARADLVDRASRGGYELADGTRVDFDRWFGSRLPEINVLFLTPLTPDLALSWGIATGQRGPKYRIDPGLHLGLLYRVRIDARRTLALSVTTLIGGNLRERACVADFGEIGGVQRVNCRLAASPLPPADTLDHNMRARGSRDSRAALSYVIRF